MNNKTLKEEILKEIEIQSLKKLKFNIVNPTVNSNNYSQKLSTKALIYFGKYSLIEINDAISTDKIELSRRMNKILILTLNDLSIQLSEDLMNNITAILDEILGSFFSDMDYLLKENIQVSKTFAINTFKYIRGEISLEDAIFLTIKAIVSSIIITSTFVLEKKIYTALSSIVTPIIADVLAKAFSIIVSSLAIVLSIKIIELMINVLLLQILKLEQNMIQLEQIEKLCQEFIPQLTKDRKELIKLHYNIINENDKLFSQSFEELKKSLKKEDVNKFFRELTKINEIYGKDLEFKSFEEFDEFMKSDRSLFF